MTVKVWYDKSEYSLHRVKEEWCTENIGQGTWGNPKDWVNGWPTKYKWTMNTIFGNSFFYFKEESDATMFILRWGPGV